MGWEWTSFVMAGGQPEAATDVDQQQESAPLARHLTLHTSKVLTPAERLQGISGIHEYGLSVTCEAEAHDTMHL